MDERTAASVRAYDEASVAYQQHWKDHRPLDAIRKFASLAGRGASIIDVACGPVLDVRLLRDAGLHVVAGDLSFESMRLGKTFFPKGSLACWDFRQLPFGENTFGGVWAPAALQHLPVAEIRPALAELRRVHARGPIFLSFPHGVADLGELEDEPAGNVHATRVRPEELQALLLWAGYVEVEVEERPDPFERDGLLWVYGWGRLRA